MSRARKIGAAASLALIPVTICAAVVAAPAGPRPGSDNGFGGYERVIQDVYSAENLLKISGDPARPIVEVDPASLEPVLRDYFERSYLRRDIERNDPRLWRVKGTVIGIAAGAHDVPSPFAPGAWHGDVTFANAEPRLVLQVYRHGEAQAVEITLPNAPSLADVATADTIDLKEPVRTTHNAHLHFVDGGVQHARVRVIAGRVWIQAEEAITVNGAVLEAGLGVLLDRGAEVVLGDKGDRRATRLRLVRDSVTTLSEWNGVGVRYRDARYRELALAIESAMDTAVARCTGKCGVKDKPLHLTLDRELDRSVQLALGAETNSEEGRPDIRDRWPAAVTVVDALNGDVLAMASYEPLSDTRNAARRVWSSTPLNYSFEPMAVGSAAKPLITAAILAERPELASLNVLNRFYEVSVNGRTFEHSLLNLPIELDVNRVDGLTEGASIGMQDYLQYSSNLYAAALMILGIDRDPNSPGWDAAGSYSFGDGPPEKRVPGLALNTVSDGTGFIEGLPKWWEALDKLYGINEAPRGGSNADLAIWRHLPGKIGNVTYPNQNMLMGFSTLSPLHRNWALTSGSRTLRKDYVPIILGGQGYGWSTINLAEGYSRLVTGKRVSARLVAGEEEPPGDIVLPDGPRQALCHGLALVAETGTASDLAPQLREIRAQATGATIRLFSKTGTPEIDRLSSQEAALYDGEDALLASNQILMVAGKVTLARSEPPPRNRAEAQAAAASLIRRGIPERVARRTAARMLRFNAGSSEEYVTDAIGRPLHVLRPSSANSEYGHVYVFVVTVHREPSLDLHRCDSPPVAAFAVAINMQEEHDKRSARKVAAALLREGSPLRNRILAAARAR